MHGASAGHGKDIDTILGDSQASPGWRFFSPHPIDLYALP